MTPSDPSPNTVEQPAPTAAGFADASETAAASMANAAEALRTMLAGTAQFSQEALRRNLEVMAAMAKVQSPQDFWAIQSKYGEATMKAGLEELGRITGLLRQAAVAGVAPKKTPGSER